MVPLRIAGSLRSPTATSDTTATVTQNAGTVAGALLGAGTPLGLMAGALGGKQAVDGPEPSGECAAARPAAPAQQKAPDVGGVLNRLFR